MGVKKMIFRPLRADEIECRIGLVTANGFTLLLYKDARTDRRILDETVPDAWCNTYRRDEEGRLICNVRIRFIDDHGAYWIEREDTGTESYSEKEKGEFSDAFKRACFKWGIGDALYSAPLIFVRAKTDHVGNGYRLANKSDGYGYKVAEIEYLGGRISHLIITKNGSIVYSFHEDDTKDKTIDEKMAQMVLTMAEESKNKEVLNAMGIRTPADVKKMTMTQYAEFARRCNDD
jgi:hypothetical protein